MQVSESDLNQMEQLISQIADLAGSQGLSDIESLAESALLILEKAKLTALKQEPEQNRE